jgi:hypothetical protein
MRVSNCEMGALVRCRQSFRNNNQTVYGLWLSHPDRYVVNSYGSHFPMYIWENGVWFGNADKYSVTTSKHQSQCHPGGDITWLETHQMRMIARNGYLSLVKERMDVGD